MTNIIQYRIQENSCRTETYDKYDIAHNTGTNPAEQKQPYDKYDTTHTTGTIHAEQKQPYDKYHIAHNT